MHIWQEPCLESLRRLWKFKRPTKIFRTGLAQGAFEVLKQRCLQSSLLPRSNVLETLVTCSPCAHIPCEALKTTGDATEILSDTRVIEPHKFFSIQKKKKAHLQVYTPDHLHDCLAFGRRVKCQKGVLHRGYPCCEDWCCARFTRHLDLDVGQ